MLASLAPQMTNMTPAPAGGGGGGGGRGGGGAVGMGTGAGPQGRGRGPTPQPPPPTLSAPAGMPNPPPTGNAQGGMAPTGKYGQGGGTFNSAGQPTVGGQFNNSGQPIITGGPSTGGGNTAALTRAYIDAQGEVKKYENPRTIYEKGVAGKRLPIARERMAAAKQNMVEYEKAQAAIANEQDARKLAQVASARFGMDAADQVYQMVMNDPTGAVALKMAEQLTGDMSAEAGEGRANAREDQLIAREEADRRAALQAIGIDPAYESAFSAEHDENNLVDQLKFLREVEEGDVEKVEKKFALRRASRLALDDVENAMRQTERSLAMVSDWSAGLGGWALEKIAGTDSTNLAGLLDTQKAYVAFRELMEMRQASKTGGALGNVSNREIELLYNSFATLNKDSDPDVLRTSLNDILMSSAAMRFGLENEQKYVDMIDSGEMTMDEAYDAMDAAQSKATNAYMAKKTRGSEKSLDRLYAIEDIEDRRDAQVEFESTWGWRPRV